jgi:chromosome segregation ATPase
VTTDNHIGAPSFDRMRNMLVRAAEVRESEQQQIFDALDDIYARLAPVDSLGAVRKRLSELPDRTEVSVLAERLDEAMSKLEAQDNALANLARAVESIVDKLAKPFAQLDGRLDGVAARFEGVAGRMDGLEDKLESIHRRLDELNGHLDKQDSKLDALPAAVHGPVKERVEETGEMVDSSQRLDGLSTRLDQITSGLESLTGRIDKVENTVTAHFGDLGGTVKSAFSRVEDTLSAQPDTDSVSSVVRKHNEESERRIGGQLDEAMATFAELMLGGGPAVPQISAPAPAQRQPRRARNGRSPKPAEAKKSESSEESSES